MDKRTLNTKIRRILLGGSEGLPQSSTIANSIEAPLSDLPKEELEALNRRLRARIYKLQNMVDVSFQLNADLSEERIIRTYLLNMFGLISMKSMAILVSDSPYSNLFKTIYSQGFSEQETKQLQIRKTDPFIDVLVRRAPVTSETRLEKNAGSDYMLKVRSFGGRMITPIVHRAARLGLVIVGGKHNGKPYSDIEREMFVLLTNSLAVALANARIYREMERISLTDPLTGLFNRRYFENNLKSEVARARRFNHPLSLVMLDVDHFKNYNDKLGHSTGDMLLRDLASVMTKTVRSSDIIARYGGEEFCVVLPEISKDGAITFSERLRDIIFTYPFSKREIQPTGRVTVSLGVATYPSDTQQIQELVEKADDALYQAKNSGRNQVGVSN